MNELKLVLFDAAKVVYQYTPEGEGEPGEIVYSMETDDCTVSKRASNDESGRYGYNATRRVVEYIQKKNLPLAPVQAWH